MRVSFFGKGGSGKTTVAASFSKFAKNKVENVIAIDGDVNTHLGKTLGMNQIFLEDRVDEIGQYFEENRKVDGPLILIGTTPPDYETNFIKPSIKDKFFEKYSTKQDNLRLVTVGTYTDDSMGASCYHSKLGVAEIIYNRLLDDENMMVVTDGTAGIDSVGTSTFLVSDVNVFVIEPTSKSIDVFLEFEKITQKYNLNNYVVLNKIMDDEDLEFVKSKISEDKIIGIVPFSKELKKFEQGDKEAFDRFVLELDELNEKIYEKVSNIKRNWDKYRDEINKVYILNCLTWYNDYYNMDLLRYINPEFSYNTVINNLKKK